MFEHGKEHLPVENLLSGQGLVNIYRGYCKIDGIESLGLTPSQVSAHALNKTNVQCVKTMALFSQVLGATAGDVALTMGAFGGIYLSGGILPKVIDCLDETVIVDAFQAKGIQTNIMSNIPIHLVSAPMPALVGAAHWMYDTTAT